MNERIKELVKIAERYALDKANEPANVYFEYTYEDNLMEKFAELIVRECQLRVERYIYECGEVASMPDAVIMKHFGIEE